MNMNVIRSSRKTLYVLGLVTFALAAITYKPFAIVNAGERGVLMQFGRVEDRVLGEGFHPILPIINSVQTISVRVQKNDINSHAASRDLQDVNIEVAVNWHIDPAQANRVFQRIGTESDVVTRILNPAVSEVVKATIAKRNVEEILVQRTELKNDIDTQLAKRLETYGLVVDDVSLVDFVFSPEFNKAIEAKQVAEQQAKQATFLVLKAAKEAEAEINKAKGQAEAQRLQQQTLTPILLQRQAIEKWDGKFPTVMGGSGALPFINIEPSNSSQTQPR